MRRLARTVLARFPLLRESVRYHRELRSLSRQPPANPLGFRFAGHPLMEAGLFELDEVELIRSWFPRLDVVVNVGANSGYYVCLCAQAGMPVIAFEPLPANLRLLYRNLGANGWQDRAEIFPLALSDRAGLVDLFGSATGASLVAGWAGAPDATRQMVPANTLDAVMAARLAGKRALILVDIEGAELALLRGAVATLDLRPRPTWIVEICVDENQPAGRRVNPHLKATFQCFWERGYRVVTADTKRREITPAVVEETIAAGRNLLGHYNFLATDAETP